MFDYQEIRKLVELVESGDIGELEVTRFWSKIRIRKKGAEVSAPPVASVAPAPAALPATPPPPATVSGPDAGSATAGAEAPAPPSGTAIKSPMVGTFYASPAPDADPFVAVGQKVRKGQVVCIVEAMKLMNEIESEVDGTIVKVLVENAQPVQYDQELFLVDAD